MLDSSGPDNIDDLAVAIRRRHASAAQVPVAGSFAAPPNRLAKQNNLLLVFSFVVMSLIGTLLQR